MAAKSGTKVAGKESKSSAKLSAKPDSKSGRKKVTMEEDEGEERESMAFKVLSVEQTNELMKLDVVAIQDKLQDTFKLENTEVDLTQASVLDFYTSAVYWGIQQKFTAQQLSGFFTVMHTLLDNAKEKHMSLIENTIEFNKMFAGVGSDEGKTGGLDFFSLKEAKSITQYVYTTFFQQYKLFLFMFTHSQAEEIIGTDLEVHVAKAADIPFPPPLDEGVTDLVYDQYIVTPPPSPTPEPEQEKPDAAKELEDQVAQSDLFAELTPDDVREVIESVTKEMLGSLQSEMALKLQEKENQIIQRINKIHKVAD